MLTQLVGCAYEGADHGDAIDALDALGLYDRDVLLAAALRVDETPAGVREHVYDLLAGAIGAMPGVRT